VNAIELGVAVASWLSAGWGRPNKVEISAL
jgi:hypothetical protein